MPLTSCPSIEILHRVLLGQVSRHDLESLEGHLVGCQTCADALSRLSVPDALVEAVHAQPAAARRLAPHRAAIEAVLARVKASTNKGTDSKGA